MKYKFIKVPIDRLVTTGIQVMGSAPDVMQIKKRFKLDRPIPCRNDGEAFVALGSGEQIDALKTLRIAEVECLVLEEEPPAELLQLMDEFERKNSHPVVEAICIRTLRSAHKFTQPEIARFLSVTKSTVCDTESISRLPKEILDDAMCYAKIAKCTLIRISRMKASDQDKTAAYELAMSKPNATIGGRRQLADLLGSIRKGARALDGLHQIGVTEQLVLSKDDLLRLEREFYRLAGDVWEFLNKYGASYRKNEPDYFL